MVGVLLLAFTIDGGLHRVLVRTCYSICDETGEGWNFSIMMYIDRPGSKHLHTAKILQESLMVLDDEAAGCWLC
jgi:hypothetical protein